MRVLRWTNGPYEAQNDHIQRTAHDIMIAQRTSYSTDSLQNKKRVYIFFIKVLKNYVNLLITTNLE